MKIQKVIMNKNDSHFVFSSIQEFLPNKYINEILARIEKPISSRQIRFILNGERTDNYNVINTAVAIALEEKQKRELLKKSLKKLKK